MYEESLSCVKVTWSGIDDGKNALKEGNEFGGEKEEGEQVGERQAL
jgi:hypothetical protein